MKKEICAGLVAMVAVCVVAEMDYYDPKPFGEDTSWAKDADNLVIGEWWKVDPSMVGKRSGGANKKGGAGRSASTLRKTTAASWLDTSRRSSCRSRMRWLS